MDEKKEMVRRVNRNILFLDYMDRKDVTSVSVSQKALRASVKSITLKERSNFPWMDGVKSAMNKRRASAKTIKAQVRDRKK